MQGHRFKPADILLLLLLFEWVYNVHFITVNNYQWKVIFFVFQEAEFDEKVGRMSDM